MKNPWTKKLVILSRPNANRTGVDGGGNPLIEYGEPPEHIKRAMHALLVRKGLIECEQPVADEDGV